MIYLLICLLALFSTGLAAESYVITDQWNGTVSIRTNPQNRDVYFYIHLPSNAPPSARFRIMFTHLDVTIWQSYSQSCLDYVKLEEVSLLTSFEPAKALQLCGSMKNQYNTNNVQTGEGQPVKFLYDVPFIGKPGEDLRIYYYTYRDSSATGFSLNFTVITDENYPLVVNTTESNLEVVTGVEGRLSFTSDSSTPQDMYWRIVVPDVFPAYQFQLNIPSLSVPTNNNCNDYSLSIYDGASTNDSLVDRLCGSLSAVWKLKRSSSSSVLFHLHSKDAITVKSFTVRFHAVMPLRLMSDGALSVFPYGNKVMFYGYKGTSYRLDVYDMATFTTLKISVPVTKSGSTILIQDQWIVAGEQNLAIYNLSNEQWNTSVTFPRPRNGIATAAVDDWAFFVGGYVTFPNYLSHIDVFNVKTYQMLNMTTPQPLTQSSQAATVGQYLFVADRKGSVIQVFDTKTWAWLEPLAVASDGVWAVSYPYLILHDGSLSTRLLDARTFDLSDSYATGHPWFMGYAPTASSFWLFGGFTQDVTVSTVSIFDFNTRKTTKAAMSIVRESAKATYNSATDLVVVGSDSRYSRTEIDFFMATCPAGFYCIVNSLVPKRCAAGYYCPANSHAMTACPVGCNCPAGISSLPAACSSNDASSSSIPSPSSSTVAPPVPSGPALADPSKNFVIEFQVLFAVAEVQRQNLTLFEAIADVYAGFLGIPAVRIQCLMVQSLGFTDPDGRSYVLAFFALYPQEDQEEFPDADAMLALLSESETTGSLYNRLAQAVYDGDQVLVAALMNIEPSLGQMSMDLSPPPNSASILQIFGGYAIFTIWVSFLSLLWM